MCQTYRKLKESHKACLTPTNTSPCVLDKIMNKLSNQITRGKEAMKDT
jgi:hypothetical protein